MIELLNIDCMEYMKTCKDKEFDLAIVDPPYRDENAPTKSMRKLGGKMNGFGKKPDEYYFDQLRRVSKNQIVWGAQYFINNLLPTNCMVFWYKHNPMKNYSDGEFAWTSFSYPSLCFNYPYHGCHEGHTIIQNKIHPTQKPVKLYSWLLEKFGNGGGRILDTHLGSGSSAIAAHYAGYDFVGCEIDTDYYNAAMKRFKQQTAQTTIF